MLLQIREDRTPSLTWWKDGDKRTLPWYSFYEFAAFFFDCLFLQAYQEFSQNQSPTFPAQQTIGIFLLSVCHPDIAGLE